MTYTVLIVDDHPLFRRGVAQLLALEPDVQVVGEAAHGAAALELAAATNPDLILLDLELKRTDGTRESGIDVLRALKAQNPARPVVMVTVSDATDDLVRALRASADGYLLKDSEPEELLARVREALMGQTVISGPLAGQMASALRAEARGSGKPGARDLSSLTEREQAVLRHVAAGEPNRRIAAAMNITETTVKAHLKHVMRKLNFRSRVEAAVFMVDITPRGEFLPHLQCALGLAGPSRSGGATCTSRDPTLTPNPSPGGRGACLPSPPGRGTEGEGSAFSRAAP